MVIYLGHNNNVPLSSSSSPVTLLPRSLVWLVVAADQLYPRKDTKVPSPCPCPVYGTMRALPPSLSVLPSLPDPIPQLLLADLQLSALPPSLPPPLGRDLNPAQHTPLGAHSCHSSPSSVLVSHPSSHPTS